MPSHVVTLIAADVAAEIADIASRLAAQLGGTLDWLAPGKAADIFFDGEGWDAVRPADWIRARNVDLVVQRVVDRRKRLLVADMESTMIENEMLDELADLIGIGNRVAAITARAMNGEIDFAASLRERVALFKAQPESLLAQAAARIRFTPGARTLARTMQKHGAHTVLVSGGFTVFSGAVADALGFERNYANDLAIENGRFAGMVREPILDAAGKAAILGRAATEFAIAPVLTLAVGDGANDLPMLEAAGLGIAYHAKPHVQARIARRIDHADLTALLYIQGYRDADFVR